MHHLTTSHCSVAQVELRTGLVYLVSAYFQYSDDIQPHIRHLERVLEALKGKPVIIAVDTNTHSSLWHSRDEQLRGRGRAAEERREALEAFIIAKGLIVNNSEGEPDTICSPNGASNIDATLSTRSVKIGDWRVHEDVSTSDHRLITFAVLGGGTRLGGGRSVDEEPARFRDRGVDWAAFRSDLSLRVGSISFQASAEKVCGAFSSAVVSVAIVSGAEKI
ncbi:unnamed protein product [Leptosia nina]|uniref:Endonuclease/exonuclease/phosphatase domain-containing protein n=1 Tax=Leptosia nina TaxID=320188 RepID=A0AAV1K268_9NEOP